ncbi:Metallo-dependent phosphatase-like protein [Cercophora samala]|uniref:Metallo-dependent phosphatase-like protein n=1 Tax=Cercophora samala TaxID=330535 RepID=A0AA39ZBD6_9PEZI|nr:Metallo-dependent phosphatase-like protein [Cercophora samala]
MQRNAIKTSFLILSDTHAEKGLAIPSIPVDVAIHCGDLTEESKLHEFQTSLDLLRRVNAKLKLVIAGNHDFTLDKTAFQKKGTHTFNLQNGAKLTVYASPYTPSLEADDWGFQYKRGEHHEFNITNDVDVVITHGPPNGVLDRAVSKQRLGCEDLFAAVARARPKMHCFGHVHSGWGAKLVAWREVPSEKPSHFSDINNGESVSVESLASILPGKWDAEDVIREKEKRLGDLRRIGYRRTSHCVGDDEHPIKVGSNTLFVNAAIQGHEDGTRFPWVVDIELLAAVSLERD